MNKLVFKPQDRQSIDFAEAERQKTLNLLDFNKLYNPVANMGTVTYDYTNKTITYTGATAGDQFVNIAPNLQLKPNTVYTLSVVSTQPHQIYVQVEDIWHDNVGGVGRSKLTFTTGSTGKIKIRLDNEGGVGSTCVFSEIMLNYGSEAIDYQPYNGVIINDTQLNEAVEKRELIHRRVNIISIQDSTLTTFKEYFDLFETSPQSNYFCGIGYLETSNFKTLVGEPSGFANYTSCCIKKYCKGFSEGRFNCYELLAFTDHGSKIAKGYIYMNAYDTVVFTGWNVIGG